MNNKHYELTDDTLENSERILRRIRATRDIPEHGVKQGDIGGFVESYDNLSDNAWVYTDAKVFGDAQVFDDALVCGNAQVFGNARVYGHAQVCGRAALFGHAEVFGRADVLGDAQIGGDAVLESIEDYIVFKNFWSSGRYFTWTRSNNMWRVGCFYGTGEELIKNAYKDSEKSGKLYEYAVNSVNEMNKLLKEGE